MSVYLQTTGPQITTNSGVDTISFKDKVSRYSLKIIALSAIWGAFSVAGTRAIIGAIFFPQIRPAHKTAALSVFASLFGMFLGCHKDMVERTKDIPLLPPQKCKIRTAFHDTFIKKMVQTFDRIKEEEPVFDNNPTEVSQGQPSRPCIKSNVNPAYFRSLPQAVKKDPGNFQDLPNEIKAIVAEYSADMSSWFAVTDFFSLQSTKQHVLQTAIANRLELLTSPSPKPVVNEPPLEPTPSSKEEQLFASIFRKVINEAKDEELKSILSSACLFQSTTEKIRSIFSRIVIAFYSALCSSVGKSCLEVMASIGLAFSIAISHLFFGALFFHLCGGHPVFIPVTGIFYFFYQDLFIPKYYNFLNKLIDELRETFTEIKYIRDAKKEKYLIEQIKQAYKIWMQLI